MPPPATPEQDVDAAFAARLKEAREERNFTQGAVATRTKMIDPEGRGVSRTAIIAYEQGTTKPGIRELRLLCEVLHATPNWLIYGTESASTAALPSLELVGRGPANLRTVLSLSFALLSLKGHERDSLLTIALSLAGRQLGDLGLSSVMTLSGVLAEKVAELLEAEFPEQVSAMTLEEFAAWMAEHGLATNQGNRFRLDAEGGVLNPEDAVYPPPPSRKSR